MMGGAARSMSCGCRSITFERRLGSLPAAGGGTCRPCGGAARASRWTRAGADDREGMRALFETLGARVISAGNGQEAMDRLREAGADVVLCDLRMPQVDGFEFIRRLRADPKCHGLPAIAVSGVGSGGSRL